LTSYTLELRVKVIRIIDGDTFTGVITQGFDGFRGSDDHPVKVRCALINAPEMKTGAGPAAKAYAETLLAVGPNTHAPRTSLTSTGATCSTSTFPTAGCSAPPCSPLDRPFCTARRLVPNYPLGRSQAARPDRSLAYAYKATPRRLIGKTHTSHIGILDQGNLGSCTGNATVGALGCDPYFATQKLTLDEKLAISVYSLATTLDDYSGAYPPTDTGSSGLAAAKSAQRLGLISGYQHAFNLSAALTALQDGPIITGIDWYESFFTPSTAGLIAIQSRDTIEGGHEVCIDGYDDANQLVWFRNSWTDGWGVKGRACMSVSTWAQLLASQTATRPSSRRSPSPHLRRPLPRSTSMRTWRRRSARGSRASSAESPRPGRSRRLATRGSQDTATDARNCAAAWPAFCASYEGRCTWLYLDTKRLPTTGLGHRVFTVADMVALPWLTKGTRKPPRRRRRRRVDQPSASAPTSHPRAGSRTSPSPRCT
jgi:hypothetical protein